MQNNNKGRKGWFKPTHGLSRHPLYKIWGGMINRCNNKNEKNYGAKGVKVCDEWKTFMPFYDWAIANGWQKGLELDKDKKAPNETGMIYSPEFCQFLTQDENNKYRDFRKMIVTYKGQTKPLYKLCKELGLKYGLMKGRIRNGWNIEEAVETPVSQIKMTFYNGEEKLLIEWCKELGLNYNTVRTRINASKWSVKEAFETPIKTVYRNTKTSNL